MKITTNGKWLLGVAVALSCLVPCALAQETLELVAVNGNNYDGIYIGPYDIQVGGPSGQTSGMICDDFDDEIGIGNTWTATPHSFSDLTGTLFGGNVAGYEEAAALSYAMLFGNQGATNNALMQYAIWAIFSGGNVQSYIMQTLGSLNGAAVWATIQGWITWAANNPLSAGQLANFVIWTPNCAQGAGTCQSQEFIEFVGVPEGGDAWMYLLLAGVSCFGAMFYSRSQRAKREMA